MGSFSCKRIKDRRGTRSGRSTNLQVRACDSRGRRPVPLTLAERADSVGPVTSEQVRRALQEFVEERDWAQFHSPANLAKSVSIEAAELLECFQWSDDADADRVREELADVVTYCILLAEKLGLDLDQIVLEKLRTTAQKYPVNRAKGTSAKYDAL